MTEILVKKGFKWGLTTMRERRTISIRGSIHIESHKEKGSRLLYVPL